MIANQAFSGVEKLPRHMREAMSRYILDGHPIGSFLQAVLSNDLEAAFRHADHINRLWMMDFVGFLRDHAPAKCWGSVERIRAWQRHDGLNGAAAAEKSKAGAAQQCEPAGAES